MLLMIAVDCAIVNERPSPLSSSTVSSGSWPNGADGLSAGHSRSIEKPSEPEPAHGSPLCSATSAGPAPFASSGK